jgi:ZIP family zinc transporter
MSLDIRLGGAIRVGRSVASVVSTEAYGRRGEYEPGMLELLAAALVTVFATGLGAIPVFWLGDRADRLRPFLLGLAGGVMAVAAVAGLLIPALDEGDTAAVSVGLLIGVAFLMTARRLLGEGQERREGPSGTGRSRARSTSILVFAVLFVHSLPEGLALGTAYASTTEGLATFIFIAIAIQNIPEGTSVAIPMQAAGYSRWAQFWAAVGTSAPQPVGAVIAYLVTEQVRALLPFSFAFAAGAMLALVVVELMPDALRLSTARALAGAAVGAAAMFALSLALGV